LLAGVPARNTPGWAPVNADALPSTPRWPLADVVTWLDGSVFE
jgi:hypothetical protein